MGKDAYYFSHDSNARTDTKMMAMLCDYKASGYGCYWAVIEMLSEQDGYKLKLNKLTYNAVAMAMLCDCNTTSKFINDCINEYELFESDGEYFWSNSLIRRMEIKDIKRQKRAAAGKKGAESRWGNENSKQNNSIAITNESQSDNNVIAINSKEKESKEKEINNIYTFWNEQKIIVHKKLTKDMEKAYKKATVDYSDEDIKTSIQNYGQILKDDKYFFNYKWGLDEFLNRGIKKFLDWEICSNNFLKEKSKTISKDPTETRSNAGAYQMI